MNRKLRSTCLRAICLASRAAVVVLPTQSLRLKPTKAAMTQTTTPKRVKKNEAARGLFKDAALHRGIFPTKPVGLVASCNSSVLVPPLSRAVPVDLTNASDHTKWAAIILDVPFIYPSRTFLFCLPFFVSLYWLSVKVQRLGTSSCF